MKDQDVDEAHGKSEEVYSKGGVPHVEKNGLIEYSWSLVFRANVTSSPTIGSVSSGSVSQLTSFPFSSLLQR